MTSSFPWWRRQKIDQRQCLALPPIVSFSWIVLFLVTFNSDSLFHGTRAFRPPLMISQELGCSPTLSLVLGTTKHPNFFFDPLQVANEDNFARLRESELKHGRVAMLAVLETMVIPFLRMSPSVDPKTSQALKGGFIPGIAHTRIEDVLAVVLTCAMLETVVFVQRDPQAMPGDYGTGYFGIRDKGLNEAKLVTELENGRLAMLAVAIQIINEVVTGESWDEQWFGYFKQWIQQFL
ncbi:hypothetical protein ACA910_001698 [Epithemia clementina (nom. ined.)]